MSADRLSFDGIDLLNADEATLRDIRGRRIAMVMQDPKYSLNPVMTVGKQIREAYQAHARTSRAQAERRALDVLAAVRIRDPERVYHCYPNEVSGGMGQRVMIAMMLVGDPDILIADEPTSALDVTVQMQVLAILDDLVSERGLGLIFISHDLNLVASFCDRVLIMYAGQVVETCAAAELHRARHPYTQGLLAALPRIDGRSTLFRYCAAIPRGSTCRFLGIHSVTGEGSGGYPTELPQRRRRCSCRLRTTRQPRPAESGGLWQPEPWSNVPDFPLSVRP